MDTILDRIVQTKQQEVTRAKNLRSEHSLRAELDAVEPPRGFLTALAQPGMRIIAEIKKASPSAGVIRPDFDPPSLATIYEENGAECLSVLTDETYFQGHLSFMTAARATVRIPVLRKEFVIDPYQVVEARWAGADAVLLIAECLPGQLLQELVACIGELGMDVLLELHEAEQLDRVLQTGVKLIGINNRNLKTFETRLSHTVELMKEIPNDRLVIGESGIKTRRDVEYLESHGVKGILVGESLMRSADVGAALRALRSG